jgi:hypothetical protein
MRTAGLSVDPRRAAAIGCRGALVLIVLSTYQGNRAATAATTTQVALFTGFGALPGAGMDILNAELATAGIANYQGRVFGWTQRQAAFDWIEQLQSDRLTLVLMGHSFGGNSALQLANDFLKPAGVNVDLTIQIDSVTNFGSGGNDLLPTNVEVGINYYQISTGFFEPQGEDFVRGATNINTEVLFNDSSITHNSIDNDPRLYALIAQNIKDHLNREDADFDSNGRVDGADLLTWQAGFGVTGTATLATGDANGDREVNRADFDVWQQQFGTAVASPLATQVVPEPSSAMIVAGGLFARIARRRRQPSQPARWG